ncbi:hypothetical protein ONE63_011588 [Megalurothrips usitatus]|uniref:Uncharacterized protein n=1 Tax=Megalurothrips usitatus TaxID=439358 RepID=A0AAV7WYX4_9NEOP|nr:hypothetical protein ONE63_011588 [Megalurothrips usitatus]
MASNGASTSAVAAGPASHSAGVPVDENIPPRTAEQQQHRVQKAPQFVVARRGEDVREQGATPPRVARSPLRPINDAQTPRAAKGLKSPPRMDRAPAVGLLELAISSEMIEDMQIRTTPGRTSTPGRTPDASLQIPGIVGVQAGLGEGRTWQEAMSESMESVVRAVQANSAALVRLSETLVKQASAYDDMFTQLRLLTSTTTEGTAESASQLVGMELPLHSTAGLVMLKKALDRQPATVTKLAGLIARQGGDRITRVVDNATALLFTPEMQRRVNWSGSVFTEEEKRLGIPEEIPNREGEFFENKTSLLNYHSILAVYSQACNINKGYPEGTVINQKAIEDAIRIHFNHAAERDNKRRLLEREATQAGVPVSTLLNNKVRRRRSSKGGRLSPSMYVDTDD